MAVMLRRRWEDGWIRTRCGGDGCRKDTKGFRFGCAETVVVIATCIDLALFVYILFIILFLRLWYGGWRAAGVVGKNREELVLSGVVWIR